MKSRHSNRKFSILLAFLLRIETQRDGTKLLPSDLSDELPVIMQFKPRESFLEKLERAQKELQAVRNMDDDGWAALAQASYSLGEQSRIDHLNELTECRQQGEAMLAQLEAWLPPLSYEALKIKADSYLRSKLATCGTAPFETPVPRPSLAEFKRKYLATLEDAVARLKIEYENEISRVTYLNRWLDSLLRSLPNE